MLQLLRVIQRSRELFPNPMCSTFLIQGQIPARNLNELLTGAKFNSNLSTDKSRFLRTAIPGVTHVHFLKQDFVLYV
jgi:hypothetical protein